MNIRSTLLGGAALAAAAFAFTPALADDAGPGGSINLGYGYADGSGGGSSDIFNAGGTLNTNFNENWGFRAQHQYEIEQHWMQQQTYSIYRDLRNWTVALAFRVRDPHTTEGKDYSVAFTFSLKAMPKVGVGEDTVRPSHLLGY